MAEIQVTVVYDGADDPEEIAKVLDTIAEATGSEDFGLQVNGEHRDPDEPADSLF